MPARNKVTKPVALAAVVITYNPDAGLATRLKAIRQECARTYIVDNGSDAHSVKILKKIAVQLKLRLIALSTNRGIAEAQNIGMVAAFADKADGVILFDHDSTPDKHLAQNLVRTYNAQVTKLKNPAIVGSRIFDINMRAFAKHPVYAGPFFRRRNCNEDEDLTDALMCIASGTLIMHQVYDLVGQMRSKMFIDYVDWEYCLRAWHTSQVPTVISGTAILHHARGVRVPRRVMGISVNPPGYTDFRYAHIFFNRAWLLRRYIFRNPAFASFELIALARDFLLLIVEPRPLRKLRIAISNWLRGLIGMRRAVPK
jgi:rhamnosyltransferase